MVVEPVTEQSTLDIPVDVEHGALRFSITVLFFAFLVGGYIVLNALIQVEGFNIFAVLGAIFAAWFFSNRIEKLLKHRWPSGRTVQVSEQNVRIMLKGTVETQIDGQQQVNVLASHFVIGRHPRAPKGWYVVALTLEQDNNYVPVYTFMSPDNFQKMPLSRHFSKLPSRKELNLEKGDRDLRMAGQMRRLETAEQARWNFGAEMTNADFVTYLTHLQAVFPTWMLKD